MPRQSEYTHEIAAVFCRRLMAGDSVRKICDADDMPDKSTIYVWLSEQPAFADLYMRARAIAGHATGDEADQVKEKLEAGEIPPDVARVMLDAIKWSAGRKNPRVYGELQRHEHGGPDGAPIPVRLESLSDAQLAGFLGRLDAAVNARASGSGDSAPEAGADGSADEVSE